MIFPGVFQSYSLQNICSVYTNLIRYFCIFTSLAILTSCGSQPATQTAQDQQSETIAQSSINFLDLAASSTGALAEHYRLEAFKQAILNEDFLLAEQLVSQIEFSFLSEDDVLSGQLSQIHFLINDGQLTEALELLQFGAPLPELAAEWDYLMGEVQRELGNSDVATGHFYWCTKGQISQSDYRPKCTEKLWRSLLDSNGGTSFSLIETTEFRAWAELANIIQSNRGLIELQTIALQSWFFEHLDHPARLNPPPEVASLIRSEIETPLSIALVLPLSGRLQTAGEAILDGFLSALYETGVQGYAAPIVEIFDSGQLPIDLIAELISRGDFDVAIGPLDSENVSGFIAAISDDQQVLSLNRLPDIDERSSRHLGYSLAVESEAVQTARSAVDRKYQRAVLLIEDSGIGERAAGAFAEQWVSEERQIQDLVRLSDATSLTGRLEQSFHVDQSEQRKNQLQTLLGKRLEFTPRRRQDVDTIFLASNAMLARQVAPTLAFLFAQDVPLLAISRIYEESADSENNRDLEPVEFLSPPWLLEDQQPLEQASSNRSLELQKLEAMGVDAYYLSRRFQQLSDPSFIYRGKTGNIFIGLTGNLERTMEWVQLYGNQLVSAEN